MSGYAGGESRACSRERPCPICGHADWCLWFTDGLAVTCMRAGSLPTPAGWRRMSREPGPGGGLVFRVASPEAQEAYQRAFGGGAGADEDPAAKAKREADQAKARRIKIMQARRTWSAAVPCVRADGSWHPVFAGYLGGDLKHGGRGIDIDAIPAADRAAWLGSLRVHERCPCWRPGAKSFAADQGHDASSGRGTDFGPSPALIGAGLDAAGEVQCVQRVWLEPGEIESPGANAVYRKRRLMHAGEPVSGKRVQGPAGGAAVRLGAEPGANVPLVLVEGIETAMAVLCACAASGRRVAVWACISTSGLRALVPPPWLAEIDGLMVLVAADYDRWHERLRHRPGVAAMNIATAALRESLPRARVMPVIPRHTHAPSLIGPGRDQHDGLPALIGAGVDGVDLLDIANVHGPAAVVRVLDDAVHGPDAADRPGDRQTAGAAGSAHGGGGDGVGGGDGKAGGVGMAASDDRDPPLLPADKLDRAMIALEALYAPGPECDDGGDGGEGGGGGGRGGAHEPRWRLAYVPSTERWYTWCGTHYEQIATALLRAQLRTLFAPYVRLSTSGKIRLSNGDMACRVALSGHDINEVLDAMIGECAVDTMSLPVWAPPTHQRAVRSSDVARPIWGSAMRRRWRAEPAPDVLAMPEGLLDVRALRDGQVRVRRHTPRYLSASVLPYSIAMDVVRAQLERDPRCEEMGGAAIAALCPQWMRFLADTLPGDEAQQTALQQWFGLCLTDDMTLELMALFIGPPGSGKGTTVDALVSVIGDRNVAVSSLNELTGRFEAMKFDGRRLIIFDEFGAGSSTDVVEATRRLKSMIGGAPISADIKHGQPQQFLKLTAKILATTNEVPRLTDASNAMLRRMVPLVFGTSFVGREDRGLKARVRAEAAGIAAWSLIGLRSLALAGDRITPSLEGRGVLEDLAELSSPVSAFVGECCVVGESQSVYSTVLYDLYTAWAEHKGHAALSASRFGAQLRAAVPGLRNDRIVPHGDTVKRRVYGGLRPRAFADADAAPGQMPPVMRIDDVHRLGPFEFAWPPASAVRRDIGDGVF